MCVQLSGGHKTIVYDYFECMRWDYWLENSRELAPSQTASWIREKGAHIMCAGLLLTVIVN